MLIFRNICLLIFYWILSLSGSSVRDSNAPTLDTFAFAGRLNLDCRSGFSNAGVLSVPWATRAHQPRRESAGHTGSSPRQSGASHRRGASRRQSSARFRGLLLGRWSLSRIFETCVGGPPDVPQRIRVSRTSRSVGSRCKDSSGINDNFFATIYRESLTHSSKFKIFEIFDIFQNI